MTEFKNATALTFADISNESFREYVFPRGEIVRISEPMRLHVGASGGHRLFSADGTSHYIPTGWIHLRWVAKPGCPHFDL